MSSTSKRDTDADGLRERIASGRTDLVFDFVDYGGVVDDSLLRDCAYYGDVSAVRFLVRSGASLGMLGDNYDVNGAAFHGHWRLCQFLIEEGGAASIPLPDTGETPLHSALCTTERVNHNRVMRVLLAAGADPNARTVAGVETGGFMRDVRTRGETPLHRAAAFGDQEAIRLLLDAGAHRDAKDANGDSPLTWASWHLRPTAILRMLCYGDFRIRPDYAGMAAHLSGEPEA